MKYKIIKLLKIHYLWRFLKKNITKKNYITEGNIFIEKYKLIYFPIPKIACSSIKSTMIKLLEENINNKKYENKIIKIHSTKFPFIKRKEIGNYNNYIKFAFVRNPYDRIVSCYKNLLKDISLNNSYFINGVPKSFLYKGNFTYNMSFKEFVTEISKISDNDSDGHFISQYKYLVNSEGNLEPEYIGRFENLNNDLEKILKKAGINGIKLPHLLKSNRKNYKEYYDNETKKIVTERYKRDLELFNYTF